MWNEPPPTTSIGSQRSLMMEKFQGAASYVSRARSKAEVVGVHRQLRLYGLFKIVTTQGQHPGSGSKRATAAPWDFEGSAKWNSWQSLWEEMRIRVSQQNPTAENSDSAPLVPNQGDKPFGSAEGENSHATATAGLEARLDDAGTRIAQLAAQEYIQLAKDLGWTGDLDQAGDYGANPGDHLKLEESCRRTGDGIEFEEGGDREELMELVRQNYAHLQQQQQQQPDRHGHGTDPPRRRSPPRPKDPPGEQLGDGRRGVERDDYGLEITPAASIHQQPLRSPSTGPTHTSSKKEGFMQQQQQMMMMMMVGPSVSKPITTITTTTTTSNGNSNHLLLGRQDGRMDEMGQTQTDAGPSPGYLHDLVLDHDRDHVQLQNYLSELMISHPKQFHNILNHYHNGYTAFHLACDQGDLNKVQVLTRSGVDVSLKDQFDQLTGAQLATEAGMHPVVKFLSLQ